MTYLIREMKNLPFLKVWVSYYSLVTFFHIIELLLVWHHVGSGAFTMPGLCTLIKFDHPLTNQFSLGTWAFSKMYFEKLLRYSEQK